MSRICPGCPGREQPVSVRVSRDLRAWFEDTAARRRTTRHALMMAALKRYRDQEEATQR